ncbi:MAG TPA: hypothetical protein VFD82_05460 [Planctomycetota bacterium]|nr:hypothetical protein [Planctomycetota bacterium]
MRNAAPVVALIALAACAAPGGHRAEAHGAQPPQEPRHIDQLEPKRLGITVATALGAGNVAVHVPGTPLDDRADAWFVKLSGEGTNGAALHVEAWSSETELFSGITINDGIAPAPGVARLQGVQVFPHVRIDTMHDAMFHMPLRLGLFVDWQEIDHDRARVEREWLSLGPKLLFEPTWRVIEHDLWSLDLYGRVGGEIGNAWFSEQYRGGDDRDSTGRWAGELGVGVRAEFGGWHAELGYQLHQTTFGEIDSALYGDRDRTEVQRQQLFLGFAIQL